MLQTFWPSFFMYNSIFSVDIRQLHVARLIPMQLRCLYTYNPSLVYE